MRSVPAKFPEISRIDAVRAGQVELRRRGPPGPVVVAGLARRPGAAGRGAHPRRAAAARPRRARVVRASTTVGHRPLPRRHRAPRPLRLHRVAVGALVVERDAQPGQQRAAAEQPHRGDGRPPARRDAGRRVGAGEPRRGWPVAAQLRHRRAVDDDRSRHRGSGRPGRARRQPARLAPHPPGARRGERRLVRRTRLVPRRSSACWPRAATRAESSSPT